MNQQHRQRPALLSQARGRRPATAVASLVMVLVALVATGCGASQPPAAAAPPAPADSTPAATTPSSPSSATAAAPATGDPASDREVCQAISLNLSFLTKAATSPDDPTLAEGIARIRHLAAVAPAEIKNDLVVIADFDQHVLDQLRASQRPEIKETPELTAALSHEAKWAAEHC